MIKSSLLCFSIIFIVMNIITPPHIYSRGIKEDIIEKNWDRIEYSDNFKYYNVIFNRDGEKIWLEKTIEPMYGQEIVIIYETNNFHDGEIVQFIVFDYNMKNSIYKNIRITNGEIKFEGRLLTDKKSMENLMYNDNIQFFCLLIMPDLSMVKSVPIDVNLTFNVGLIRMVFENPYILILESDDGEYRQIRDAYKDGILFYKRDDDLELSTRLIYTGLIAQKRYRLILRLSEGNDSLLFEENILDLLDYYDDK